MGLTKNHDTRYLQSIPGDELSRYIDHCMTMAFAEARNTYREELHKGLDAQAENQNVRRRAEKEAVDARNYAATAFARDVLSVADNLQRALQAIPADLRTDDKWKGLVTGLDATGRELDSVLGRHGITKIEAMGQPLDPNKHQAMIEMPSDQEPGTIVQEMQSGYMIKDRLLRPALVAVAKKPD